MPSPPSTLRYPVLCISPSMGVSVARCVSDIERCRAVVFWRGRFYEGLRLVDARGEAHEVVKIEIRKPTSSFGQRVARLLDLSILVSVEAIPMGPASLSDVVYAVDTAIAQDPEAFEEFSGRTVSWWKEATANCSTVRDVMEVLQEIYPR